MRRLDPGLITALAAGLVSVSALAVSIYEAYLQRQEQRIAVWPILEHWTAYSGDTFGISVANKGIGPASIVHVGVSWNGEAQSDWRAVFDDALGERAGRFSQSMLLGNVMAPGESNQILGYDSDAAADAWLASRRVTLHICYCSVFGDCWNYEVTDLVGGRPSRERVDACLVVGDNSF